MASPVLWIVRILFEEGLVGVKRAPVMAFDTKDAAKEYADQVVAAGRKAAIFKVVYQSEVLRRVEGYRQLREFGLAE